MNNYLKEKLKSGKAVFGMWSIIPSPIITEIAGLAKIDFQILDLEHGAYDIATLENSIRTAENSGCSPLVRIAGIDPFTTQKALDFGAHGIIYPQVKGANEANDAVMLTKYSPAGVRGFNPFTRVDQYSLRPSEASRNSNDFALTGVIVENKSAADELEKILAIKALDIVYLGSYDMSVALGKPGDMANPELQAFMERSIRMISKAGKVAGVMAKTPEQAKRYYEMGAKFIVIGVDSFLIGKALMQTQEDFSKLF